MPATKPPDELTPTPQPTQDSPVVLWERDQYRGDHARLSAGSVEIDELPESLWYEDNGAYPDRVHAESAAVLPGYTLAVRDENGTATALTGTVPHMPRRTEGTNLFVDLEVKRTKLGDLLNEAGLYEDTSIPDRIPYRGSDGGSSQWWWLLIPVILYLFYR
jgi:hypothetical protein